MNLASPYKAHQKMSEKNYYTLQTSFVLLMRRETFGAFSSLSGFFQFTFSNSLLCVCVRKRESQWGNENVKLYYG